MVRHYDQLPPKVRATLRRAVSNIPAELVQQVWWRGRYNERELVQWIRKYDLAVANGKRPSDPMEIEVERIRETPLERLIPRPIKRLLVRD